MSDKCNCGCGEHKHYHADEESKYDFVLAEYSNAMTDEEIDKLEELWEVRIGTGKKRKLYTTEYIECKYLYVE